MRRLFLLLAFLLALAGPADPQTAADPNEGSRLNYDRDNGIFTLSWWGQAGRTYFLQHSEDLLAWQYLPLIESGNGEVLSWGFTSTRERNFFRLKFSDLPTADPFTADFDGDKVSNYQELLNGTDPLHSADTDDDGLPDDWEIAHFGHLGHHGEEDAPGGYTILQKFVLGLNPTLSDSDDDGVEDSADHFPGDSRRSESIPVSYYGAINLTQDLENFPEVFSIALDDSNQVAFAGRESSGTTSVAIWKDGEIIDQQSLAHMDYVGGVERIFTPTAVNASGTLTGKLYKDVTDGLNDLGFTFSGGSVSEFQLPSWGLGANLEIRGIAQSGAIFGWAYGPAGGFFGQPGSFQHYGGYPGSGPYFSPWAISPSGGVAAGQGRSSISNAPAACLLQNGALTLFNVTGESSAGPASPYAVNDQRQVVGFANYAPDGYPIGFFYTPASGNDPAATQSFPDLLPEKYRQQLRSAIPYLLTNADPTTGHPTITFAAEVLKGDSEGDWVPGVFQWEKSATGETTIHEVQTAMGESPVLLAQNSSRDYAGQGRPLNASESAPATPAFIPRVEFLPVDIDKGFDPSMEGDKNDDGSKDEDKKPRETWTSVSRKAGGKFIKNENIKLVFNSAAAAKLCEVVVREGASANLISIPTECKFPQEKENILTIEGKPGAQNIVEDAFVEVRNKTTGKPINILSVKVMPERTIRYRVWYLKDPQPVWSPQDPQHLDPPLTEVPSTPSTLRGNFEGGESSPVLLKLRAAFRQACIDFVEAAPPGEIVIDYDLNGDGALQINNPDKSRHPEYAAMLNSPAFTAPLNILVVRRVLDYLSADVAGIGTEGFNKVFVFTDPLMLPSGTNNYDRIPWICAHEVGHALSLSTRNRLSPQNPFYGHDSGIFPSKDFGAHYYSRPEGLMIRRPEEDLLWLRHEDWEQGSIIAGRPLFQ